MPPTIVSAVTCGWTVGGATNDCVQPQIKRCFCYTFKMYWSTFGRVESLGKEVMGIRMSLLSTAKAKVEMLGKEVMGIRM